MSIILIGTILKIVGEVAICAGGAVMMKETAAKVTKGFLEDWAKKTDEEAERLAKERSEQKAE